MALPATSPRRTGRTRRLTGAISAAAALSLTLSACAGSAGSGGGAGAGGGGEGYEAGADQAAIDEALADLDPVTIIYQPSAASQESVQSPSGTVLAEAIEERSGGKITVDMVWGQAIAPYGELDSALADGRVDLAYSLPVYKPAEYPALNALGDALGGSDPSPFVGEMVTNAMALDVAWNTPEIVAEYEEKGLTPISPITASGGYYSVCSATGMTQEDFQGRQVRIASKTQGELISHMGASPVSMEYTETYEALQRGTVDCTLGQLVPSAEAGIFEVAPNVGYMTETSFSRAPGALVAGSGFAELPLAYQQVIFDSYADYFQGQMMTTIGGNADGIRQAKEAGGEIEQFPEEFQTEIAAFNEENLAKINESGPIEGDLEAAVTAASEKWTAKAAELGYEDGGTTADMDQWYDVDSDFRPLGQAIYDEVLLPHRPS
ncbi:TRAP transporter substrate-binding protein DctP [Brevibacterium album]|uniref:TRAP transporter substrate-binding protein DctP n=1 Tax=Brevibacterium album TaxID=417948 RepID=UPI0003F5FDF2|nr:TRAP transporter substrate-binding protein DctP [Brevibacterium album]